MNSEDKAQSESKEMHGEDSTKQEDVSKLATRTIGSKKFKFINQILAEVRSNSIFFADLGEPEMIALWRCMKKAAQEIEDTLDGKI